MPCPRPDRSGLSELERLKRGSLVSRHQGRIGDRQALLGPTEKDSVPAVEDPLGRGIEQSDRPLSFLRGDRQPPGRQRDGLLAGADRGPREAEAPRIRQSRDDGRRGPGQGVALQEKI